MARLPLLWCLPPALFPTSPVPNFPKQSQYTHTHTTGFVKMWHALLLRVYGILCPLNVYIFCKLWTGRLSLIYKPKEGFNHVGSAKQFSKNSNFYGIHLSTTLREMQSVLKEYEIHIQNFLDIVHGVELHICLQLVHSTKNYFWVHD